MARYLYTQSGGVVGYMDSNDKYLYSQQERVIAIGTMWGQTGRSPNLSPRDWGQTRLFPVFRNALASAALLGFLPSAFFLAGRFYCKLGMVGS
jgi:hypothetical protein